jgi:hypothetical protein
LFLTASLPLSQVPVTEGQFVSLVSSDDFEFIISRKCALESGTIKSMLSGPGTSKHLPPLLPTCTPHDLAAMWLLCRYGWMLEEGGGGTSVASLLLGLMNNVALCWFVPYLWEAVAAAYIVLMLMLSLATRPLDNAVQANLWRTTRTRLLSERSRRSTTCPPPPYATTSVSQSGVSAIDRMPAFVARLRFDWQVEHSGAGMRIPVLPRPIHKL